MKFLFVFALIFMSGLASLDSIREVNNVTTTANFTTTVEVGATFTTADNTTITTTITTISAATSTKIVDVSSAETIGNIKNVNITAYLATNENQTKREVGIELPTKQFDTDGDSNNSTDSVVKTKIGIGLLKNGTTISTMKDSPASGYIYPILISAIIASIILSLSLFIWKRRGLRRNGSSSKLDEAADFEERLLLPLMTMMKKESVPLETF